MAQNVPGFGHGKFRMYGRTKNLGFWRKYFVDKGQATIKMLNTTYFFNDTNRLTRNTIIRTWRFTMRKKSGKYDRINYHGGMFQNMKYNVDVYGKKYWRWIPVRATTIISSAELTPPNSQYSGWQKKQSFRLTPYPNLNQVLHSNGRRFVGFGQ